MLILTLPKMAIVSLRFQRIYRDVISLFAVIEDLNMHVIHQAYLSELSKH